MKRLGIASTNITSITAILLYQLLPTFSKEFERICVFDNPLEEISVDSNDDVSSMFEKISSAAISKINLNEERINTCNTVKRDDAINEIANWKDLLQATATNAEEKRNDTIMKQHHLDIQAIINKLKLEARVNFSWAGSN